MVDQITPFFWGSSFVINSKERESFANIKYKIKIKVIVPIKDGTIKEFTSISPSVSLSKKKMAITSIIKVPTILGRPKN